MDLNCYRKYNYINIDIIIYLKYNVIIHKVQDVSTVHSINSFR